MNAKLILWPVMAQILLTWIMFIILGLRKSNDLKKGLIDKSKTALDNKACQIM